MSSRKEEKEMRKRLIFSLAAQGLSVRAIADDIGLHRSTVHRILTSSGAKEKIRLMTEIEGSVLVPSKEVLSEEKEELKEIEKEIKLIPLDSYEYQATTLSVQQLFIDKAMRNMRLSDRLEDLATKLTDRAHLALELPSETKEQELATISYINRMMTIAKVAIASQTETARLALSLIEVGLQTGEIAKYLESQD